ncbi:MAG: hypothetical protein JRI63_11125 [Deltaproteobacteria bacterium]|nr:hypothetical protein [Deltaproteobacteria bacterium]
MKEEEKSKEEILKELALLRKRISELEMSEETLKTALDDLRMGIQNRTAELKTADERIEQEIDRKKRAEGTSRSGWEQMLSIFDSINQFIYVVDSATYRIFYANQALRDAFKKPLMGGICYEELQGLQSPCEFRDRL